LHGDNAANLRTTGNTRQRICAINVGDSGNQIAYIPKSNPFILSIVKYIQANRNNFLKYLNLKMAFPVSK